MNSPRQQKSPWTWIPTLYFAEGLPYVLVMVVSVVMYKNLGISNTEIAFYTSWLYLPWVIKPFWSPFVDVLGTRRKWILILQLLMGAGFAGVSLTLPMDDFFRYSLMVLWLLAFSSATHDIAADGYYIAALTENQQTWFVGIRSTFYRLAMISGQGLLVMLAGKLEEQWGDFKLAWSLVLYLLAGLFILIFFWHAKMLPATEKDHTRPVSSLRDTMKEVIDTLLTFFQKKDIIKIVGFLLLYRFAESQLVKLAQPFMMDERSLGGLGLSTMEVGFTYGTVGIVLLSIGGILGGLLAARQGMIRSLLMWMVVAINLPNLVYLLLAIWQPESLLLVNVAVGLEQFGYGFGFTAYMVFMLYVARGEHSTAHFAICTGFMALGMMLPGMFSGWLQEALGYTEFFVWILLATLPSFYVTWIIPMEEGFGRKEPA